jgi:hypothetical protein
LRRDDFDDLSREGHLMKILTHTAVCAALSAFFLTSADALADPITQEFAYQVWGDVGTRAGTPIGNFDFEGAPYFTGNWGALGGQFSAPGSFPLGEFVAQPLPAGASLTYSNLPFYLQLNVAPAGTDAFLGGQVNIQGVLNGTATGSTSSTVIATITSVTASGPLPFPLADLRIDAPQALSPDQGTLLTADVVALPSPAPIPEPSGWLVAVVMATGAVLQRARGRSRERLSDRCNGPRGPRVTPGK